MRNNNFGKLMGTGKQRDYKFDTFKGILIFLVVFGHLIGEFKDNNVIHTIWRCIYLFHMPAFAFISGYFFKERTDCTKKLLIPLFVFQILYEVLHFIIYKSFSYYTVKLIPYWILWYLLSLFFWRIIYSYFKNIKLLLIISVIIGLLSGISSEIGYTLSLSRTIVFFPFFVFGNKIKNIKIVKESYTVLKKIVAVCFLIGGFLIFILFCNVIPDKMLNGSYNYKIMELSSFLGMMYRIIVYSLSSIVIIMMLIVLPTNKHLFSNFFSQLGRNSMMIYLFHGFIIRIIHISTWYKKIGDGNVYFFLFLMFMLAFFICVILSLKYVELFYKCFISKIDKLCINETQINAK